jgi:hypothetical protein
MTPHVGSRDGKADQVGCPAMRQQTNPPRLARGSGTAVSASLRKRLTMGQNANPSEDMEWTVVVQMAVGQSGYVNPSAMSVDGDGHSWLREDAEVSSRPFGPAAMRVELRADGYHVWPPSDELAAGDSRNAIQVAEVHRN